MAFFDETELEDIQDDKLSEEDEEREATQSEADDYDEYDLESVEERGDADSDGETFDLLKHCEDLDSYVKELNALDDNLSQDHYTGFLDNIDKCLNHLFDAIEGYGNCDALDRLLYVYADLDDKKASGCLTRCETFFKDVIVSDKLPLKNPHIMGVHRDIDETPEQITLMLQEHLLEQLLEHADEPKSLVLLGFFKENDALKENPELNEVL